MGLPPEKTLTCSLPLLESLVIIVEVLLLLLGLLQGLDFATCVDVAVSEPGLVIRT